MPALYFSWKRINLWDILLDTKGQGAHREGTDQVEGCCRAGSRAWRLRAVWANALGRRPCEVAVLSVGSGRLGFRSRTLVSVHVWALTMWPYISCAALDLILTTVFERSYHCWISILETTQLVVGQGRIWTLTFNSSNHVLSSSRTLCPRTMSARMASTADPSVLPCGWRGEGSGKPTLQGEDWAAWWLSWRKRRHREAGNKVNTKQRVCPSCTPELRG